MTATKYYLQSEQQGLQWRSDYLSPVTLLLFLPLILSLCTLYK